MLQYNFVLDGGRSNQQLSIINHSSSSQTLTAISIITNTDIKNPWQVLGSQWSSVQVQQQGNFYIYKLLLTQALILQTGINIILEYSIGDALGPITNVAMPPKTIQIQLSGSASWQTITPISSNNPVANPHPQIEFNMYHANWGQYAYKRTMADEQFQNINCLSYAFIGFDATGKVFSLDSWADELELPTLAITKPHYTGLKTTLAFGGWTNAGERMDTVFSQMAANPATRKTFVTNAVNAVLQAGADGIDIDWEYVAASDANNFINLLQELRTALNQALGTNARLTIAAPAGAANINIFTAQQWQMIAKVVDRISIMDYDYYGSFSAIADFHSPWKLSPNSPNAGSGDDVTKTLALYKQMGVPAKKLSLGIPNYARGVIVAEPGQYAGLYQPVLGAPVGEFGAEGGIYSWNAVWALLNKQASAFDQLGVKQWQFYDSTNPLCQDAKMCLLCGELPNGQWVVFNFVDQISASWRAQQITQMGLGGTMVWANYFETLDPTTSITQAISTGLNPDLKLTAKSTCSTDDLTMKDAIVQQPAAHILAHQKSLRHVFFAPHLAAKKVEILDGLIHSEKEISEKDIKTLATFRNPLKHALQKTLPKFTMKLFDESKSLKLADRFMQHDQLGRDTSPDKIIITSPSELEESPVTGEALFLMRPPVSRRY